jgi:hypothetical protein
MNFNRARMSTLFITICLVLLVVVCNGAVAQTASSAPSLSLDDARVDLVDADHGLIVLTDCPPVPITGAEPAKCSGPNISASSTPEVKSKLKLIHQGDHVKVSNNKTDKGFVVSSIEVRALPDTPVAPFTRFAVMALAFLAVFLLAVVVTRGHPFKFIIGADNRYSNSKLQMTLWFSILISSYIALVAFRVCFFGWDFWGGVDIPIHLLTLSGLSAITYGAAKGITTSKVQAALDAGKASPKTSGVPNLFVDLVSNDNGGFDLGDFQMLVVTLLAVVMYLMAVFHFLGSIEFLKTASLPDVDTTILASFGLGQGAYLTKKAAGNAGTS